MVSAKKAAAESLIPSAAWAEVPAPLMPEVASAKGKKRVLLSISCPQWLKRHGERTRRVATEKRVLQWGRGDWLASFRKMPSVGGRTRSGGGWCEVARPQWTTTRTCTTRERFREMPPGVELVTRNSGAYLLEDSHVSSPLVDRVSGTQARESSADDENRRHDDSRTVCRACEVLRRSAGLQGSCVNSRWGNVQMDTRRGPCRELASVELLAASVERCPERTRRRGEQS